MVLAGCKSFSLLEFQFPTDTHEQAQPSMLIARSRVSFTFLLVLLMVTLIYGEQRRQQGLQ